MVMETIAFMVACDGCWVEMRDEECSITVFCRIFSGRGFYLLWFY